MSQRVIKSLVFLFFFLLPTQLGLHFWPDWSIVRGIRVDYFSPTLNLTDILAVTLIILILRLSNFSQIHHPLLNLLFFRPSPRLTREDRKLAAASLLVLLNIIFSLSPPVSFYYWIKIFETVLLALTIRKIFNDEKIKIIAIRALSCAVVLQFVLVLWQFLAQHSVGGFWYFLGERNITPFSPGVAKLELFNRLIMRPYGTFSHPNVLGGWSVVVLSIILVYRKYLNRKFFILTLTVGVMTVFLSLSRLSIFSVFIILFFCINQMANRTIKVILISLSIFLLVVGAYTSLRFETTNESLNARLNLSQIALEKFAQRPLLGTGLGTSPIYTLVTNNLGTKLRTTNLSLYGQPTHNTYFLLLAEVGVFPMLIGGYILLKYRQNIILPIFLLLFLALFDHYWLTSQQGLLLVGLIAGLSKRQDKS